MDFEQLRTFLQVCRLKSFSRAAEKLGVTQPAISAQIRSLEKEIGARLFDRDGGKVTFTAAGRLFEPFAEHCLQCQSHIIVAVNELYRSARGEVSVSASEATSLYVLPPVFAQYKKHYTRVNLNIVRAEHLRSLEAVMNREVDFAVVSMPVKDPRLVVQVIHRDDMVLAVAPTHPLATRSSDQARRDAQVSAAAAQAGQPAHAAQQLLRQLRRASAHRHGTGFERTAQAPDLRRTGHGISAACQRARRRARAAC